MTIPMLAPVETKKLKTVVTLFINLTTFATASVVYKLGPINIICGAIGVFFFAGMFPAIIFNGVMLAPPPERREGDRAPVLVRNGKSGSDSLFSGPLQDSLLPAEAADNGGSWRNYGFRALLVLLVTFSFLAMVLGLRTTTNFSQDLMANCRETLEL